MDPGTVNTKMLLAGWGRIGIEVGQADNTYRLLTDAAVAQHSGCYFVGHRQSRWVVLAVHSFFVGVCLWCC